MSWFAYGNVPKPYDIYHLKPLSDVRGILASIATVIAGSRSQPKSPMMNSIITIMAPRSSTGSRRS